MRNLTEFVAGDEMKYYQLKMLKKLLDFGHTCRKLEDFSLRNLENVCHSELRNLTLPLS
jgi:hypothetical protein